MQRAFDFWQILSTDQIAIRIYQFNLTDIKFTYTGRNFFTIAYDDPDQIFRMQNRFRSSRNLISRQGADSVGIGFKMVIR